MMQLILGLLLGAFIAAVLIGWHERACFEVSTDLEQFHSCFWEDQSQ